MVTLAEPDLVKSDCKTAVTVTVGGLGAELGAVYIAVSTPEAMMAPTVAMSPPVLPFTCQVTAELPAFCTSALKDTVPPVNGFAEVGNTVTITGGGALEDTRPPQEIWNVADSGARTRKRNERV